MPAFYRPTGMVEFPDENTYERINALNLESVFKTPTIRLIRKRKEVKNMEAREKAKKKIYETMCLDGVRRIYCCGSLGLDELKVYAARDLNTIYPMLEWERVSELTSGITTPTAPTSPPPNITPTTTTTSPPHANGGMEKEPACNNGARPAAYTVTIDDDSSLSWRVRSRERPWAQFLLKVSPREWAGCIDHHAQFGDGARAIERACVFWNTKSISRVNNNTNTHTKSISTVTSANTNYTNTHKNSKNSASSSSQNDGAQQAPSRYTPDNATTVMNASIITVQSVLYEAAAMGYRHAVSALLGRLGHYIPLTHVHPHTGCTALHEAAHRGDLEIVIDICEHHQAGAAAAYATAVRSSSSATKAPGREFHIWNAQDQAGQTPLFRATLEGHEDVVQLLLRYGADPSVGDTRSVTPLHIGAWRGSEECLRALLRYGASAKAKDDSGECPFKWVPKDDRNRAISIYQVLRECGGRQGRSKKLSL